MFLARFYGRSGQGFGSHDLGEHCIELLFFDNQLLLHGIHDSMRWRGRRDSDPRNVREHVHTDYKSGALSRSATSPH